ncbi:MAG: glycoside hydrolase family 28 protein, partial [Bacteroidales bacterium]
IISLLFIACNQENSIYNIKDYGAIGDSITLDQKAIQKAVDKAYSNGGGTVLVPAPGRYLTGTIVLKDNINFKVEAGAKIVGSDCHEDYIQVEKAAARGKYDKPKMSEHLIYAINAKNITISGKGTIDGNGFHFWESFDTLPRWIKAKPDRVSNLVEIIECQNINIEDITLINSPEWTCHIFDSDDILIDGVRIINNLYGPNNDGIDMSGVRNVRVTNCNIKTCDDAICLKTLVGSRTTHNVTVTNCVLQTTCVALKLGETVKDMSDITFSNCVITESSRAFGIYATWGGHLSNILVDNIVCNTNAPLVLNRPFQISAWNRYDKEGNLLWEGGSISNVIISNFVATTEGRALITANHDKKIENITLENIQFIYPYIENPEDYAAEATSNQFYGIEKDAMAAKASLVVSNVDNIMIDHMQVKWPVQELIPEEWNHPERIENGKFEKVHRPEYKKARQTEMHGLYLNNVNHGYINVPMLKASSSRLETIYKTNTTNLKIP